MSRQAWHHDEQPVIEQVRPSQPWTPLPQPTVGPSSPDQHAVDAYWLTQARCDDIAPLQELERAVTAVRGASILPATCLKRAQPPAEVSDTACRDQGMSVVP